MRNSSSDKNKIKIVRLPSKSKLLTLSSNNEDIWILKKTNSSIELEYSGETVFTLNFSEYGEECKEVGAENVIWLYHYLIYDDNGDTNLQYRPQVRGGRISIDQAQ